MVGIVLPGLLQGVNIKYRLTASNEEVLVVGFRANRKTLEILELSEGDEAPKRCTDKQLKDRLLDCIINPDEPVAWLACSAKDGKGEWFYEKVCNSASENKTQY